MTFSPDTSVAQIVIDRPSRAVVFEKLGIDYCCRGQHSLAEACERQSLESAQVIRRILDHDAHGTSSGESDWSDRPLALLVDHIVSTHHNYLRNVMPQLSAMTAKIADVHGGGHPELLELHSVYQAMHAELESHMMKEEMMLFPAIREQELAQLPPEAGRRLLGPIAVMLAEHDSAGEALAAMRELTDGYTAPADACNTYRGTFEGLKELEADLHMHIHKENNILFPRAFGSAEEYARLRVA